MCHLAGLTKVRESGTGPLDCWRTNLGGTLTILDKLMCSSRTGAASHVLCGSRMSSSICSVSLSGWRCTNNCTDVSIGDVGSTVR